MKNEISTLVFFSFFAFTASAQVPQAFMYQAVLHNSTGEVMANQSVGLEIILTTEDTSNILYQEKHSVSTNDFGLVNLSVGWGDVLYGQFDTIQWDKSAIYINLWLDGKDGPHTYFVDRSQLMSIPYAIHASKSGPLKNGRKGDFLYYDGKAWKHLPKGVPGTALTMSADSLPTWTALPSSLDCLFKVTMDNGDVIYVSPVDYKERVIWGSFWDISALPNKTAPEAYLDFDGEANTAAIVAQLRGENGNIYAAKICADMVAYGFDDWYLPAAGELDEIYRKLGQVSTGGSGQIIDSYYWSSTEQAEKAVFDQYFINGEKSVHYKLSKFSCRCVRR